MRILVQKVFLDWFLRQGRSRIGICLASKAIKKSSRNLLLRKDLARSGRHDSNMRPSEPHSDALARLRHAPNAAETGKSLPSGP